VLCRRCHHEEHPNWNDERPDLAERWRRRLRAEERFPDPFEVSHETDEVDTKDAETSEAAQWWELQTRDWEDNLY